MLVSILIILIGHYTIRRLQIKPLSLLSSIFKSGVGVGIGMGMGGGLTGGNHQCKGQLRKVLIIHILS